MPHHPEKLGTPADFTVEELPHKIGKPVIVTDYYIARRQRLHYVLWHTDRQWSSSSRITDLLGELLAQGYEECVVITELPNGKLAQAQITCRALPMYPPPELILRT